MHDQLTFSEIQTRFPDEWVLLGNPEFQNARPVQGQLLAHSRDYLELCYQSHDLTQTVPDSTIVFTGQPQTHNRKWLRAIRLTDPTKTI
jgi:hypothetical protein